MDVGARAAAAAQRLDARAGLLDGLLAGVFVLAGLTTTGREAAGYTARDGLAVALILLGTVPYVVRRRAPLPVFLCSLVAIATLFALGYEGGALPTVVAVGAYTVGAHQPLREVLLAAALTNAALVGILLGEPAEFGGTELTLSSVTFGTTLLLGWTAQSRRLRLEALEREQGQAARRAAADERLRIAQELHDVIAHSLGVIAVQAGVGMHVIDDDVGEARRALEHISQTSRSSLTEIRTVLGQLRSDEGLPFAPAPGLADLHRLAEQVAAAGLPVELAVPDPLDLPPGMEFLAYRVVQEALTNALRHARAHRAVVRLDVHAGALRIEVCDDGRGRAPDAASGHGLVGMRERVAVYGGSVHAATLASGGFRVDATVPLQPTAPP